MKDIIAQLMKLQEQPEPFTPGEALFWDDPHISAQMLAAHLDPENDAASRRPEIIDRSVQWLIETIPLQPGDSILDLGCGPGLYASRLARAGMRVTGVDYSHRSIDYASGYAKENGLEITYRYQNYLQLEDKNLYDAALLIYGDFCVLSPENRSRLLHNIHRALKPDGSFVLDVSTCECRKKHGILNKWSALESGFCKPGPHLLLEEGFEYPELALWLDQFVVIETDERLTVYRNWFQDYTPESITAELEQNSLRVVGYWGDLTGTAYTPDTEWIGIITRKS